MKHKKKKLKIVKCIWNFTFFKTISLLRYSIGKIETILILIHKIILLAITTMHYILYSKLEYTYIIYSGAFGVGHLRFWLPLHFFNGLTLLCTNFFLKGPGRDIRPFGRIHRWRLGGLAPSKYSNFYWCPGRESGGDLLMYSVS